MTATPNPTPNQPEHGRIALTDPSQVTTAAGLVTLAVGVALAAKPRATSDALGLGLGTKGARALAATDLAIAPVLITGRNRGRWMILRAAMNLGIAARYRSELRRGGGGQARGGMILMGVLTLLDGAAGFALAREESRIGG